MSQSSPVLPPDSQSATPFWRDERVLRWAFQIVILLLVLGLLVVLMLNLQRNLARVNLNPFDFTFLERPAGFNISEGPVFNSQGSYLQAYGVAVVNSLRAIGVGIVLATALGVVVGVSRLSPNWLLRNVALVFIEIMQNTPLLVQLFFWFVLIRALPQQNPESIIAVPAINNSLGLPVLAYLSQRAAAVPAFIIDVPARFWLGLLLAIAAGFGAGALWMRRKLATGRPPTGQVWVGTGTALGVLAVAWIALGGLPFSVTMPGLVSNATGSIWRYENATVLSNNYQALMLGLVLYTAAFIAEVVRAGIQSVRKGQLEAATALGLTRSQQLRLVIMPQALRVIIPPLINQYLNLAKNSSLAIAVAYPDLFNISQTIGNQSGQNVQLIFMVMATYLAMSLSISVLMNWVNQRMQIKER